MQYSLETRTNDSTIGKYLKKMFLKRCIGHSFFLSKGGRNRGECNITSIRAGHRKWRDEISRGSSFAEKLQFLIVKDSRAILIRCVYRSGRESFSKFSPPPRKYISTRD